MLRWPLRAIQTQCLVPEEQELAASCTSRQPGVLRWGRATRSRQGISPSPEVSVSSLSVSFLPAHGASHLVCSWNPLFALRLKSRWAACTAEGVLPFFHQHPVPSACRVSWGCRGVSGQVGLLGEALKDHSYSPSDEGIKGRRGASTRSQH